jgi:hypothetical protein
MTTAAFVGKMYLERGEDGSPTVYTRVCQIFGIGGLGQTNALVDATTFCSGGVNEYIGGLADGSEVTLNANFETSAQILRDMITDVKNKVTRSFRVIADDEISQPVVFYFNAVCLSWQLGPSVDSKNTIDFGIKISGDIVINVEA